MKTRNKVILGILIVIFVMTPIIIAILLTHLYPYNRVNKNDSGTAAIVKKL